MFNDLDDPMYSPTSTPQQRERTIQRGTRLRRRRLAGQISLPMLLVAAIVSVLVIVSPSTLRGSPDPAEPLTPTPSSLKSAWLPVGTGIVASVYGASGGGEVLIGTTTEDGIERSHQIVRADIPGCTKGRFDCGITDPDVSPDGSSIAFEVTSFNSPYGIWVADVHGGGMRQVLSGISRDPAWSPDGREIAVVVKGDSPHTDALVRLNVATGEMRTVTELAGRPNPETSALRYGGFLRDPTWSSDGDTLAFTIDYWDQGSVIATAPADGSQRTSQTILTKPSLFANQPDWSPTQDQILFSQYDVFGRVYDSCEYACEYDYAGRPQNLYTISPDGSNLQPLPDLPAGDGAATEASWTPDGQRVVFVRWPLKCLQCSWPMARAGSLSVVDSSGLILTGPNMTSVRSPNVLPGG